MNNDRIEITDEMIACYLEGNLTEEERSAVEAYLSENDEAMDDLMIARTELAYQDDIASSPSVFAKSMIGYDDYAIAAASEKMDCAIKAQQMVLGNYGIETSMEELTELAKKNGWFEEGKGSAFDFVGELLNTYGVESVQMRNAGIYHIMHELSQGHKIIVGVDNDYPEQEDTAFGYDGAQHVMLVVGSASSSNSQKLYTICNEHCSHTYFIQSVEDICQEWFQDVKDVGITAGASTPKKIFEEVQNHVGEF